MKRTLPGWWLAVAGMALTFGCAGDLGGSQQQTYNPPPVKVRPKKSVVPPEGGGDVPHPTYDVCWKCQRGLAEGRDAEVASVMGKEAAQAAALRGGMSIPSKRAVALVCLGTAQANLGQHEEALKSLEAAEDVQEHLPAVVRPQLLELLYHAELVSASALGDDARADRALDRLGEVTGDTDRYVQDRCAVAPDRQALPECGGSESPSVEPHTSATPDGTETRSPEGTPEVERESPAPAPDDEPDTDDGPASPIES
ncbi:hypothetical protein ETD86_39165 [Nonomuraea turkmeniaca]|uniref:Tetratricopeptide repeat protein n=1 Tax=Nonomuraea turkmeniaca TaxID=103838 RepID=A0A5S4F3V6_9ACTN|nr:tetratricopeptide repeat protein [Nonomuraea turkmeniaca]TMR10524.1 hypothetical protein ETD86_39165 [Nonomuraea turkmeniaca]